MHLSIYTYNNVVLSMRKRRYLRLEHVYKSYRANALDVLDCHLRLLFYRILLCNFYRSAACLRKSKLQHLKSHFFCTYLWRHDFDFLEARCLHHYYGIGLLPDRTSVRRIFYPQVIAQYYDVLNAFTAE